jgi:hypothetical protein
MYQFLISLIFNVTANSRPIVEDKSEVWIHPLMTVGWVNRREPEKV